MLISWIILLLFLLVVGALIYGYRREQRTKAASREAFLLSATTQGGEAEWNTLHFELVASSRDVFRYAVTRKEWEAALDAYLAIEVRIGKPPGQALKAFLDECEYDWSRERGQTRVMRDNIEGVRLCRSILDERIGRLKRP